MMKILARKAELNLGAFLEAPKSNAINRTFRTPQTARNQDAIRKESSHAFIDQIPHHKPAGINLRRSLYRICRNWIGHDVIISQQVRGGIAVHANYNMRDAIWRMRKQRVGICWI